MVRGALGKHEEIARIYIGKLRIPGVDLIIPDVPPARQPGQPRLAQIEE